MSEFPNLMEFFLFMSSYAFAIPLTSDIDPKNWFNYNLKALSFPLVSKKLKQPLLFSHSVHIPIPISHAQVPGIAHLCQFSVFFLFFLYRIPSNINVISIFWLHGKCIANWIKAHAFNNLFLCLYVSFAATATTKKTTNTNKISSHFPCICSK